MHEVTEDETIELAQALEQLRAQKTVEAVMGLDIGGVKTAMPTPFQAGYQMACEEILHRLRTEVWAHCLHPTGEPLIECGLTLRHITQK